MTTSEGWETGRGHRFIATPHQSGAGDGNSAVYKRFYAQRTIAIRSASRRSGPGSAPSCRGVRVNPGGALPVASDRGWRQLALWENALLRQRNDAAHVSPQSGSGHLRLPAVITKVLALAEVAFRTTQLRLGTPGRACACTRSRCRQPLSAYTRPSSRHPGRAAGLAVLAGSRFCHGHAGKPMSVTWPLPGVHSLQWGSADYHLANPAHKLCLRGACPAVIFQH